MNSNQIIRQISETIKTLEKNLSEQDATGLPRILQIYKEALDGFKIDESDITHLYKLRSCSRIYVESAGCDSTIMGLLDKDYMLVGNLMNR